jgi:hypothetical protein
MLIYEAYATKGVLMKGWCGHRVGTTNTTISDSEAWHRGVGNTRAYTRERQGAISFHITLCKCNGMSFFSLEKQTIKKWKRKRIRSLYLINFINHPDNHGSVNKEGLNCRFLWDPFCFESYWLIWQLTHSQIINNSL